MSCFDPMFGWRSKTVNEKTGKRPIVFKRSEAFTDLQITIPCGKCSGCMISKAREWAVRCVGEASMFNKNCFVTLTYNPENLPEDSSLEKGAISGFMKSLRQYIARDKTRIKPPEVRFFACGEYGEKMGRPHYHLAIFNWDFDDKRYWKESVDGDKLYTSEILDKLWGKGWATVGSITVRSASYIARYVAKKIVGKQDEKRYRIESDSEIEVEREIEREFGLMSRGGGKGRKGIGGYWLEKYMNDVRKDFLIMNGQKYPLPRYYKDGLEAYDKRVAEKNKRERKRIRKELEDRGEMTRQRLDQQEVILKQKLGMLKRGIENA